MFFCHFWYLLVYRNISTTKECLWQIEISVLSEFVVDSHPWHWLLLLPAPKGLICVYHNEAPNWYQLPSVLVSVINNMLPKLCTFIDKTYIDKKAFPLLWHWPIFPHLAELSHILCILRWLQNGETPHFGVFGKAFCTQPC